MTLTSISIKNKKSLSDCFNQRTHTKKELCRTYRSTKIKNPGMMYNRESYGSENSENKEKQDDGSNLGDKLVATTYLFLLVALSVFCYFMSRRQSRVTANTAPDQSDTHPTHNGRRNSRKPRRDVDTIQALVKMLYWTEPSEFESVSSGKDSKEEKGEKDFQENNLDIDQQKIDAEHRKNIEEGAADTTDTIQETIGVDGEQENIDHKNDKKQQQSERNLKIVVDKAFHSLHSNTSYLDYESCSICLCRFRQGDQVCQSKNRLCVHSFHFNCLSSWLIYRDDCPLCREDFLSQKNGDVEDV